MPIRQVLLRRLCILRKERGWTQDQLGVASGLHRTYISSIESGRRNVGLDNVERIAQAFGLQVRDLLDDSRLTVGAPMNRFRYPVLLTAAEEGGYAVTCRDLPTLITQGEDKQDALARAVDAMDGVFTAYMAEGVPFPEPSKARRRERLVAPSAETLAKAALYVAMLEARTSKV